MLYHGLVVRQFAWCDDLHIPLAGAVVEFDEAEAAFGVATCANPTLKANLPADRVRFAGFGNGNLVHACLRSRNARRNVSALCLTVSARERANKRGGHVDYVW